ncbi:succinylglutamate desuccinylase/aspartoacylase family protein [Ahrensia kielensis]|uniref:Succinylglutamate desuccinylase/aspartoacylase family protein n=1 Tax=Ahrensia kielensis TaxID=76980 RepID=A0ABU9T504_9HYPH
MAARAPFSIGEFEIEAGAQRTIDLPVSVLSDHTPVTMSVHVVHGEKPGPTLFISAAIHGDEVIGVEIVRRVLQSKSLSKLRGTLLAIPIVNAFGFMNHSRYLPDRRDLNRSFPGSPKGSLAGRLAHLFETEILDRSDVGIDLHSAAIHRTNLPQIRVSPSGARTSELANAFGAPLVLMSKVREGSLRGVAQKKGVDVLLYEAGEGLRFDEFSVRVGVSGILRVMHTLGMIGAKGVPKSRTTSMQSSHSVWERSPAGGLLRCFVGTGENVSKGQVLGIVSSPFGDFEENVIATHGGLIIGRTNLPIVNEGDGLFHIATIRQNISAETKIENIAAELEDSIMADEDEII